MSKSTPTLQEMEVAIVKLFDMRKHIIVPNISWGLGVHECDLFLVKNSGYAFEVEIKRSKADLLKDILKKHGHKNDKIKELYFAVPESLISIVDSIPANAGVIIINDSIMSRYAKTPGKHYYRASLERKPIPNPIARKLTDQEMIKLGKLAAMRIWKLKSTVVALKNQIKILGNA